MFLSFDFQWLEIIGIANKVHNNKPSMDHQPNTDALFLDDLV